MSVFCYSARSDTGNSTDDVREVETHFFRNTRYVLLKNPHD